MVTLVELLRALQIYTAKSELLLMVTLVKIDGIDFYK